MYEFTVFLDPVAQPRHRVTKTGHVYDAPSSHPIHDYKKRIRAVAKDAIEVPLEGPIAVTIEFYRHRPQRLNRGKDPNGTVWAPKRPDLDNLIKAVWDALNGVAFVDDAQICESHTYKYYHEKDYKPRVRIHIRGMRGIR